MGSFVLWSQCGRISLTRSLPLPHKAVHERDEYAVNSRIQEIPKGKNKEIGGDVFEIIANRFMTFRGDHICIFKKETREFAETTSDLTLMSQAYEADQEANDLAWQNKFQEMFFSMAFLIILFGDEKEKHNSYRKNREYKVNNQIKRKTQNEQEFEGNFVIYRSNKNASHGCGQVFCNRVVNE